MGFLTRILRHPSTTGEADGGFASLGEEELRAHMGIRTYGVFELTDAIRPSYDLSIVPRQGFRHDQYVDPANGEATPVIMASVSRPSLLPAFFDLIDNLGNVVDVVLESSHTCDSGHEDLYREHIDVPVLKSVLWDFEDLLLNDGCTGIAVINPAKHQEVQLDEHKMLIAYGAPLTRFEQTLIDDDVYPMKDLKFITEAEHVHSSSGRMYDEFQKLRMRLGMDGGRDDDDGDFAGA